MMMIIFISLLLGCAMLPLPSSIARIVQHSRNDTRDDDDDNDMTPPKGDDALPTRRVPVIWCVCVYYTPGPWYVVIGIVCHLRFVKK